jgi:hypothetical protein
MGARACANLTAMSDQPVPARRRTLAPHEVKPLSSDAFFYENEWSRERAEARKRAVKRWFSWLLHRSSQTPS